MRCIHSLKSASQLCLILLVSVTQPLTDFLPPPYMETHLLTFLQWPACPSSVDLGEEKGLDFAPC